MAAACTGRPREACRSPWRPTGAPKPIRTRRDSLRRQSSGDLAVGSADSPGTASNRILTDRHRRIGCRYAFEGSYFAKAEMRSEEHKSELQSLMRISYAVFG